MSSAGAEYLPEDPAFSNHPAMAGDIGWLFHDRTCSAAAADSPYTLPLPRDAGGPGAQDNVPGTGTKSVRKPILNDRANGPQPPSFDVREVIGQPAGPDSKTHVVRLPAPQERYPQYVQIVRSDSASRLYNRRTQSRLDHGTHYLAPADETDQRERVR